jgi:multisubunit Na+/H+ antiporter MnhF subunit
MSELTIVVAVSLIGGALLGALMTRILVREVGLPPDERAMEIDKRTAINTLNLVMIVDIILLYYHWFITKNSTARDTALIIFLMMFFGIWIFRTYYARRM